MSVVWVVENLKRKTTVGSLSDVVTHISWRADLTTVDGNITHTGHRHGTVALSNPDESNFTAYASITEANAIDWVKSALGSSFVSETETSLEQQILGSKNSNEKDGLPWGATTHF